ncbi:MAG: hypothetical protein APF77_06590 [Clostridia bacterium BRH_c25]|nr:MAG: hypothetical protein APF77_06590 [Clostridia bacterium BRH_c25]
MFRIGEFAKLNRVSTKLLRHYDEIGRLDRVEKLITLFKQEAEVMNYDVVIKSTESFRVASVRGIMKHYGDQGHLWEEVVAHINKYSAKVLAGCFVSYYGEIEGKGIDGEVFEPIDKDIPSTDRVKVYYMPPVEKMACVVHQGPYENLKLAYAAITGWIEDNGYRISGNEREIYLKGEWNSKDPSEYITEIQFPVEKI